ncbi:hypothetical protein HBN50_04215 [Halobacteriovorax sp. GB3]|uniref:hypothetical protein n=1 Tax=Halobacteriovorax sp. GB3 TaxID=2719615 RepID=UPI00235F70EA|nr:hypothetical protein [Halobacteriovorax sp. GB3]MDD0852286.1 hypothetical protein [Halobacteriovorax sp. GB3]
MTRIKNGQIYRKTTIRTIEEKGNRLQELDFSISGLHPNSCHTALAKLSQYENYHEYLDFIKKSQYSEKTNRVRFFMQSAILPFNMILDFKIPRITKKGSYPFSFDKGFLKELKGTIHVYQGPHNRCLFYSEAKWKGKHTGIPNMVFELFANTLSEKSMEILFRISRLI